MGCSLVYFHVYCISRECLHGQESRRVCVGVNYEVAVTGVLSDGMVPVFDHRSVPGIAKVS